MKALFTSTLIALVTLGAAPVQAAGDHAGHGMAMQANGSRLARTILRVRVCMRVLRFQKPTCSEAYTPRWWSRMTMLPRST